MPKPRTKRFLWGERLKIFDPRRGEDFVFGSSNSRRQISSLNEGLLVILIPPAYTILNSPGNPIRQMILQELPAADGTGFICAYAVGPSVMALLPKPQVAKGESALAYFAASRTLVLRYGDVMERLAYGELTIGCSSERFPTSLDDVGAKQYDDLYVVGHAAKLQWFVSFSADTGNSYIVTRIFQGVDVFLQRLCAYDPLGENNGQSEP